MTSRPSIVLPRRIPRHVAAQVRVSPRLLECMKGTPDEVLAKLNTSPHGLLEEEAARRLAEHGPNDVAEERRQPFSPLAESLSFVPLPNLYWPLIILTLVCYVVLTQSAKVWLLRRKWIS